MDKHVSLFVDYEQHTAAESTQALMKRNEQAFRQFIPSLLPDLRQINQGYELISVNHSKVSDEPFIDAVSLTDLTCVYGPNAQAQVEHNIDSFLYAPRAIEGFKSIRDKPQSRVCVVLGLGLGWHLRALVEANLHTHIIIYEPISDFLRLSCCVQDWATILEKAHQQGITLFFQNRQDGSEIYNNLIELAQHINFASVALYKHFNTPIFNQIYACEHFNDLANVVYLAESQANVPMPLWGNLYGVTLNEPDKTQWHINCARLQQVFPDIAKQMDEYTPIFWQVAQLNGQWNLINTQYGVRYSVIEQETYKGVVQQFINQPTLDGLFTTYTATKHQHYKHHRFFNRLSQIHTDIEHGASTLPESVGGLIVFGLGFGVDLNDLYQHHAVEHLVICETEIDLFYGSLFWMDWDLLLSHCDEHERTVYLNLGDSGQNIINDIYTQFAKLGVFYIAQTYMFKPYCNPKLDKIYQELRDGLKTLLLVSEFFDYSLYGFSHTQKAIERDVKWLLDKRTNALPSINCPVFIVGNGPSLDTAVEYIKHYRDDAFIVSCGTALGALIKQGIVPDFHAEIEANYATYSWITRYCPAELMQHISLISCNGIHPDTIDLFAEVFLAVKSKESSSLHFFAEHEALACLDYAYPTVTNFALDFFITAGIEDIYLFGVDLGFVDPNHHHSKHSGYYQGNQEKVPLITEKGNKSISVPGNFAPQVQTKYEFKMAIKIMSEAAQNAACDIYNTANGAKIPGTKPLQYDHILIGSSSKKTDLTRFKEHYFVGSKQANIRSDINASSLPDNLKKLRSQYIFNSEIGDVFSIVEGLRNKMVDIWRSGDTFTYYLLHGTINSFGASLLNHPEWFNEPTALLELRTQWDEFLTILESYCDNQGELPWDYSVGYAHELTAVKLSEAYRRPVKIYIDPEIENGEESGVQALEAFQFVTSPIEADVIWVADIQHFVTKLYPMLATAKDYVFLTDVHDIDVVNTPPNITLCVYWHQHRDGYYSAAHNLWAAACLVGHKANIKCTFVKPLKSFSQYQTKIELFASQYATYTSTYAVHFTSTVLAPSQCQMPSGLAFVRCFTPLLEQDLHLDETSVIEALRLPNNCRQ